jgi:hypothetical protein
LTFDLFAHRATRVALIVAAVLVAYTAVDAFAAREKWVEWSMPYLLPHVLSGLVAASMTAAVLAQYRDDRRVPHVITFVVAATVGGSAAIASWHALIRVNQVAGGPLVDTPYVRNAACDSLVPVDARLPQIDYSDLAHDYWCSFPADYLHAVPLRRGIGGLYQVDLTAHTRAITEFRRLPRS